jgi:hypothetical protein
MLSNLKRELKMQNKKFNETHTLPLTKVPEVGHFRHIPTNFYATMAQQRHIKASNMHHKITTGMQTLRLELQN